MKLGDCTEHEILRRLMSILSGGGSGRGFDSRLLQTMYEGQQPSGGGSGFTAPLQRGVRLGIGHDAAVVTPNPGQDLVVTCDQQVAGVHFDLNLAGEEDCGRRALAAAASDLAPLGATPLWAVVSIAAPPELELEVLERFYRGLVWEADELSRPFSGGGWSGLIFIGGDTVRTPGPFSIDLTIIGQRPAVWPPGGRGGARPGDAIYLSGATGLAAGGLWSLQHPRAGLPGEERLRNAFLRPQVELVLGQRLWRDGRLTSCADTSDSLTEQLLWLAEASGCGLLVEAERLPSPEELKAVAAALGVTAVELALGGGEDFRLLVTGPAGMERQEPTLIPIGEVRPPAEGVRLRGADGATRELPPPLFSHYHPVN